MVNTLEFSLNKEISIFNDGFEAWQTLNESGQAELVIADVNIPEINGIQLLKRIKTAKPRNICILTTSSPLDEKPAMAAGIDAMLIKPYSADDLLQIIQTYVIDEKPAEAMM